MSSLAGSLWGGFWGLLIAVLLCMAVALVNGLLVTKIRMSSLIATIAMMTALTGVCYMLGHGKTVPNNSPFLRELYTYKLFGLRFLQLPVVVFVICLIVFGILLHRTRFGTGVFVAGGNAEAGYTAGINIGRTKLICFLIGGFCAGLTGVFLASYVYAGAVSYGDGLNVTIISACVLGGTKFTGGKGGVIRTLLGIAVVRSIINITSLLSFDAWAQNIVTGALLLIVLVIDRYTRVQRLEDAS
jgi:L-arabinose transport system permease protein